MVPGFRTVSTREKRFRLISRSSATASMIQSTSPHHPRLYSRFPGVTSRAVSGVKNAAGRDFFAASRPASNNPIAYRGRLRRQSLALFLRRQFFRDRLSRKQGMPAFARCAAIRAPIVPAPSTTAFSIRCFISPRQLQNPKLRLQSRKPRVNPKTPAPGKCATVSYRSRDATNGNHFQMVWEGHSRPAFIRILGGAPK